MPPVPNYRTSPGPKIRDRNVACATSRVMFFKQIGVGLGVEIFIGAAIAPKGVYAETASSSLSSRMRRD